MPPDISHKTKVYLQQRYAFAWHVGAFAPRPRAESARAWTEETSPTSPRVGRIRAALLGESVGYYRSYKLAFRSQLRQPPTGFASQRALSEL